MQDLIKKKMPKLACADFTFPLLSHGQSLDLIAMLGLQGVDIGLFQDRGHLQPSTELSTVSRSSRKLRNELNDRGLLLADVFLIPATNFKDMAPNHPDSRTRKKAREQFRRLVEYTLKSGGKHVSGLPGVHFETESEVASLRRSEEELAWRVAEAGNSGLVYSVEPHIGSIIPSPKKADSLARRVPGLTFTLDYGHFKRAGIPDSQVEPLLPFTSHFHCRGGNKDRLQASFKSNTINYFQIARAMKRVGYSGFVALEYVWIDWEHCNEVDNLSETILFRDYWRNLAASAS